MSKSPKSPQAPGNRLGAAGLILAAIGGGRLLVDIPPTILALPRPVALPVTILGAGLLAYGLVAEWRGARRWSALLPGIAALMMGGWIGSQALGRVSTGPVTEQFEGLPNGDAVGAHIFVPRSGEVVGCAVVVGGGEGLAETTGRALADRGVASTAVQDPHSVAEVTALVGAVRTRSPHGPCGLVVDGSHPRAPELLTSSLSVERAVALSVPAAWGFEAAPTPISTLYLFGVADEEGWGQSHANTLLGQLSEIQGGEPSTIRVFLGAGGDFLIPRNQPWRQPGVLAAGYADMLKQWIVDGTA